MEDCEEVFEQLEDPRTGNATRHLLHEVLMIALCTVLCGGETCADMALFGGAKREFLQQFLTLPHGIPSHDTFSRIFRLLDAARFHAWFIGFMKRFAEGCQGVVAIDGKTMRRSFDRAAQASPLHLVSAWAVDARLCLGQLAVADKSNEIVAVPKLLELLSLAGRIVTADAVSCQRKIAQQVIDQGGDHVLALKGNQETLHDARLLQYVAEGAAGVFRSGRPGASVALSASSGIGHDRPNGGGAGLAVLARGRRRQGGVGACQ